VLQVSQVLSLTQLCGGRIGENQDLVSLVTRRWLSLKNKTLIVCTSLSSKVDNVAMHIKYFDSWTGLLLVGLLVATPLSPAIANSAPVIQFAFGDEADPPDRGTPPTGLGTGSRGDCLKINTELPLMGLMRWTGLAQSSSVRPTFWIYVPYTPAQAPSGEFSLQNGDMELYRMSFALPPTPGIVKISTAAMPNALQPGRDYRWYVDINCPSSRSMRQPNPASITGIVRIVDIPQSLQQDLANEANSLERAAKYAKYGIWFETITELAEAHLQQPQNDAVNQAWAQLLSHEKVGLKAFSQAPIVGEVITNSPPK
jgi:Domain of Unknown Function (DUF928)